jgi:hypothetical protein
MAQNKDKKVGQNTPSTQSTVKGAWKKSGRLVSLKQWVRHLRATNATTNVPTASSELVKASITWLLNKKANTSKPQQGIGRTNRIQKGKK